MPRGQILARGLRLMRLLETRQGRSVRDMAADLGVTYRTVYRDIAALQEAHVPIEEERDGRARRYRVAR